MDLHIWVRRLKASYDLLNRLYKQGKFEEEVETTKELSDTTKFYDTSGELPPIKQRFNSDTPDGESLGKMRHPRDLQWAGRNLRELAQFLFENYQSDDKLSSEDIKVVILYYFRTISLSYEVDDYFLSVADETSKFLTDLAEDITRDVELFATKFDSYFVKDSEEYQELLKQILIVSLCGVNEYYRQHLYYEGLGLAKTIKQSLIDLPRKLNNAKGHWSGLKGLCGYVTGKILTAQGNFAEAEQEFLHSVEAYSESIWQKERNFFRRQEEMRDSEIRFRNDQLEPAEYQKYVREFTARKQDHELSRAVALRRSGLASSFGYGFQALVMGKVKDAIRLSSLSRGIVNWNTGKIYSAYVDLIYYSAKRAENSSDRRMLLEIHRNLKRCFRVFQDLIPAAHYKHRALFQISLVYHYLARWYKENGLALPENSPPTETPHKTRMWHFRKAQYYWNCAARALLQTIEDERILTNKRLHAESMAILGHVWSNLGLLEKEFNGVGLEMLQKADEIFVRAREEADQLKQKQIQCEVGLAQAAVGKATVEYLLSTSARANYLDETDESRPIPHDKKIRDEIRSTLNTSRQILHKVFALNQNNSVRVKATVFLRLTELALFQRETWIQAREYYDEYVKISSQVEHDFCHRWALDLENKIHTRSHSHTFTITPGRDFDKQNFDKEVEKYYTDYAVNYAARKIEEDAAANKITERDSLSSYLTNALDINFGISPKTARAWIKEYAMFEHLRRICSFRKDLRETAPRRKKAKEKPDDAEAFKVSGESSPESENL